MQNIQKGARIIVNTLSEIGTTAASETVLDYIEDAIIKGELRKGDKLPTERAMAEELNVSRASVREAIKALNSMGMVSSIQGSGNYITKSPENSIDRAVCALFALNDGTLENILQLRIILESEACREAIKYATDEQLQELKELMDYDYDNASLEYLDQQDRDFHFAIVALCKNTLIKYLYNTLVFLMDIYRKRVLQATLDKNENYLTKAGHVMILNALIARDVIAAESAVRTHLSLSDDYQSLLSE